MKLLICIIFPAILITLLHIFKKYLLEEKIEIKELILYYLKASIILNIVMILIVFIIYQVWIWKHDITTGFILKYTGLGNLLGLFLPAFLYKIKNNKITDINKKYNIITFNKDNLKDYLKNNKQIIDKLIFFISGFILFFSLDFVIRKSFCSIDNFTTVYNLKTNIITFFFTLLFLSLIYYLPKKSGKITAIVFYILWIALFIANFFFLKIKSDALSIYELNNTKEGFAFINFIYEYISIKFVLFILIEIILAIINYMSLRKIESKFSIKKLIISLLICILGINYGISLFENYEDNVWDSIYHEKYYYDNFISPKKSLSVLGLYEYSIRDVYLYINDMFNTYGSIDEIESLVEKYHTTLEDNMYTGIFKDKNVIMVMMESIDYVVVNEETMPTLCKMMKEGWNFPNRYNQSSGAVLTIATEYTSMTGLFHSKKYYNNINTNYYSNSLPETLNKEGYKTASFHENRGSFYNRDKLHKSIGFTDSYFLYDMKNIKKEGYDDSQFASNDLLYEKLAPDDGKFMSLFVTISAHGPYVDNKYCSKEMNQKECFSSLAKRTDNFLKILLDRLEQDGKLDDTVIVLYTDHHSYAYNYTDEDLALFKEIDQAHKVKHIPFVIYNSQLEHKDFEDIFVNDIDIVPTMLNLLGIKYNPDNYVGRDIFSDEHKNIELFSDYTWYDGEVYSGNSGLDLSKEEYQKNTEYTKDKITLSDMIISNNYYKNIK
ncbi:MAG: LTA synthase family protein [Bacilli bacterium]|nr:LTA synthase family protein [Bacilli bacterium]